jgi:hypothetical protein
MFSVEGELGTDVRQYAKRKKEPACSFACACGLRAPDVQTCSCIVRSVCACLWTCWCVGILGRIPSASICEGDKGASMLICMCLCSVCTRGAELQLYSVQCSRVSLDLPTMRENIEQNSTDGLIQKPRSMIDLDCIWWPPQPSTTLPCWNSKQQRKKLLFIDLIVARNLVSEKALFIEHVT